MNPKLLLLLLLLLLLPTTSLILLLHHLLLLLLPLLLLLLVLLLAAVLISSSHFGLRACAGLTHVVRLADGVGTQCEHLDALKLQDTQAQDRFGAAVAVGLNGIVLVGAPG